MDPNATCVHLYIFYVVILLCVHTQTLRLSNGYPNIL